MNPIMNKQPLGFQWPTQDPFLFCVHHLDLYPKGNSHQGPEASLEGRRLGQDFDLENDWKMYHGHQVPGFPEHPHRGFETVTIVLEGFVDHHDSSGASGRYGGGDVQWMTAGSGMQHAEMFPLVHDQENNTLHLFQIWLNLPRKDKFVDPHYKMLWHEEIPKVTYGEGSLMSEVTIIAGEYDGHRALEPAPDSWAQDPDHHVDILLIKLAPDSVLSFPRKSETMIRNLYYYKGEGIKVNDEPTQVGQCLQIENVDISIKNSDVESYLLLLQGEPIGEPVVQYGPFVMNSEKEIQDAYMDYQKTRFGGWPWDRSDPVNDRQAGRRASYVDGTVETPLDK
ncbi:MAG: pirin [Firmicutes bacterium HGW-Firmicutes-5]|nr:MAG: pirin [Firmicutes bacterium HGW-Firmicutes-5]